MATVPTNTLILMVVLIAIAIGIVAWLVMQRQRSLHLKRRFGPEYDRAGDELSGRIESDCRQSGLVVCSRRGRIWRRLDG